MEHVSNWSAPSTSRPVHATVTVPGSKSQTNRALVLAALAAAGGGVSTISGALRSRDTDLMIGALKALGLRIDGSADELAVSGTIAPPADAHIDCGLAGTVLRFVPPLAALGLAEVTFDGDEQARVRPIAPLLNALRGLGVDIDGDGLPFRVRGAGKVAGGAVDIDASASSQFVSGLLLAGPSFTDGLAVHHVGPSLPSAPHIAMTVAMLRQAGVEVDDATTNRWPFGRAPSRRGTGTSNRTCPTPSRSSPRRWSARARSASPAGRLPASSPPTPSCASSAQLNCVVKQDDSYLEVQGPQSYPGFDVNLRDVGELTPSVAVLAALAAPGRYPGCPASPTCVATRPTGWLRCPPRSTGSAATAGKPPTGWRSPRGHCGPAPGSPMPITGWRPPARSSVCGSRRRGGRHRDHRQDAAEFPGDVGRACLRSSER